MRTNILIAITLLFILSSCDFRKSVKTDLMTGLTTVGNGLSCDDVYLSVDSTTISRKTFTYGEKIFLNFNNISGFKKVGEASFPGMQLTVTDKNNDTVMNYNDLYANNKEGFSVPNLLLRTYIIIANPIHSNNDYTLHVNIWDKKGEGTFKAKMNFNVVPDNNIQVEKEKITYQEIYLFSEESKSIITDGNAKLNEKIDIVIDDLDGFTTQEGKVTIEMNMTATDASGKLIVDEKDMLGDESYDASKIKPQFYGNFIFMNPQIKSPVTCVLEVADKNGPGKLKVTAKLNLN